MNFPDGSWTKLPVPEGLSWVVCVPDFELETATARAVVPQTVPLRTAVSNMAFFGALIAGLSLGDETLISRGLHDGLHQPYRQALIPAMAEVRSAAGTAGALGCVLSGAGPTLLALVRGEPRADRVGAAMCAAWAQAGISSAYVTCVLDPDGAVCLD